MLTVTGFGVLLPAVLGQIDAPLAFTLSLLFGELWIALYAALILSFVTGGRLTTRIDWILVDAFIIGLLVLQFAALLFLPDEGNLLVVWPDAGIANALVKIQKRLQDFDLDAESELLHDLVRRHHEETGSERAAKLLADWPAAAARFTTVMPRDYARVLAAKAAAERDGLDEDATTRAMLEAI